MLKLLVPAHRSACHDAAEVFASFYEKITGHMPEIITEAENSCDMVVIGSDAENSFTHRMLVEKVIPEFKIRYGSDDYHLMSAKKGPQNLLFLAGGCTRALFYAVYDYFETFAGCHYFWDGDIIPKAETLPLTAIDRAESPRFEYRGLRYFAHRSLTRFQAEHWDFEDWKKELDWVLKKRFNLYMLRIGMDDLFQKAFPDIVSYPEYDKPLPEAKERSFDDRNLFWPLEYRGELRKKVLAYGRSRGLLHPEDCGTMSHWYSRTPQTFLDRINPDFVPQATEGYGEKTGLVWDIRQDKNLDNYFKLTETHIREYGSPDIFHTIGLAERMCYKDRDSNFQMKLYTYRRIEDRVHSKYPNAPLLLASWDFAMCWQPEEVQRLIAQLNPKNTILFDYTSDTVDEINNFTNWGVIGKFPWIFGIFQAYEASTEIRGNYDVIERRLALAADDPMCKGMILWPENSHADTLMLEYHAANTWNPSHRKISDFIEIFCQKRYQTQQKKMAGIWRNMLPLIKTQYWRSNWYSAQMHQAPYTDIYPDFIFSPLRTWIPLMRNMNLEARQTAHMLKTQWSPVINEAVNCFRALAELNIDNMDPFLKRDIIDLARTAAARVCSYAACDLTLRMDAWNNNPEDDGQSILKRLDTLERFMNVFAEILAAHKDYSLYESLCELQRKHQTNPNFEYTLKGNAENGYCRSMIQELFNACYIPEFRVLANCIAEKIKSKNRTPWNIPWNNNGSEARDKFYATPLQELAPDHEKAFAKLPQTLLEAAGISEILLEESPS